MTEKKPQMEFTPWGLQDLPERTLGDMASRGMGAARMELVPRADGGEDIVMKHVDIRTGPMPTELMDRLVHEECRPTHDEELERARRNIERWAHLDNAEHELTRLARLAHLDNTGGPNLTSVLLGVATILLGVLALVVIVFGTYGLIHTIVELLF